MASGYRALMALCCCISGVSPVDLAIILMCGLANLLICYLLGRGKNKVFMMVSERFVKLVNYFCGKINKRLKMRKLSMDELNRMSVDEFKQSEKVPVIVV